MSFNHRWTDNLASGNPDQPKHLRGQSLAVKKPQMLLVKKARKMWDPAHCLIFYIAATQSDLSVGFSKRPLKNLDMDVSNSKVNFGYAMLELLAM